MDFDFDNSFITGGNKKDTKKKSYRGRITVPSYIIYIIAVAILLGVSITFYMIS